MQRYISQREAIQLLKCAKLLGKGRIPEALLLAEKLRPIWRRHPNHNPRSTKKGPRPKPPPKRPPTRPPATPEQQALRAWRRSAGPLPKPLTPHPTTTATRPPVTGHTDQTINVPTLYEEIP